MEESERSSAESPNSEGTAPFVYGNCRAMEGKPCFACELGSTFMKITPFVSRVLIVLLLVMRLSGAHAQGTAFTYQGRLSEKLNPANGTYDLTFALFDSSNSVPQIGPIVTKSATE